MKNTGIIRKIDELGRIVIPKEIRQTLKIESGEALDIFVENEKIILQKVLLLDNSKTEVNKLINSVDDLCDGEIYVSNRELILSKGLIEEKIIPDTFKELIKERKTYESNCKEIYLFGDYQLEGYFYVSPIIQQSECNGLVIMKKSSPINNLDILFISIIKNIIEKK